MKAVGGIGAMKKLLKTGNSFLQLLFSSSPKVYWWSYIDEKGIVKQNFGDYLNTYLVEKITGKKPILFFPNSKLSSFIKHSIMIGSVINKSSTSTYVWGSGIIKKNEKIRGGKFLAVRGPRTARRLEELGFKAPKVYGDPAVLLPLIYENAAPVKYEIGIIPHFFNYNTIVEFDYDKEKILVIDLLSDDVESVLNQMLSCKKIISTSLHGLILAHAYQIPAIWWKYSELNGDDVKFYDYLESVHIKIKTDYKGLGFNEIIKTDGYCVPDKEVLVKIQKELLSVFPYKKLQLFNDFVKNQ